MSHDIILLSLLERLFHKIQRLTGKTNYFFSGVCSFGVTALLIATKFYLIPELIIKDGFLFTFVQTSGILYWLVIFLSTTSFTFGWKYNENETFKRLQENSSENPLKKNPFYYFMRTLMLLILLVTVMVVLFNNPLFSVFDILFIIFFTGLIWLYSLDPLPKQ